VAQLEKFPFFSLQEAKGLLEAAHFNDQFGWIVSDDDVKLLIARAVHPHKSHLKDPTFQKIITQSESSDA